MAAGLFLKLAVLCLAATADATDATTTTLNLDALISNLKSLKRDSQYCDDSHNGHGQAFCDLVQRCQYGGNEDGTCSIFHAGSGADNETERGRTRSKPSSTAVWGYGFLCVTAISLTSVIGVSFVPLMTKSFYNNLLSSLIGLAVGSLSGSAMFHLIPSAFSLSDVEFYPHHSYLEISIVIWAGVYLFFVIERFLKVFMEYRNRTEGGAFVGHSHGRQDGGDEPTVSVVGGSQSRCPIVEEDEQRLPLNHSEPRSEAANGGCIVSNIPSKELYEQSKQAMRASFGHMERPDTHEARPTVETVLQFESQSRGSKIATVAWMIIFGDGVHNFIDGLSIGAAFSESILTGISVSVAVFCEEFPHELGDFAVLLNAGMTVRQAMVYNFMSACTCYLGLFIGIFVGEMHMGNQYIFAAAGGMFLYIALVDMVPEMNATMDSVSKVGVKKAMAVFLLQNVGILAGIASLFVLAKFQDDIQIQL